MNKIFRPFTYAISGFYVVVNYINKNICKALSFLLSKILKKKKESIENYFNNKIEKPEYLLMIILYLVTFYSLYNIIIPKNEIKLTKKEEKKDYIDIYTTPINSSSSNNNQENINTPQYNTPTDLTSLRELNSDTVAYIEVSNTNIKYPVVQSNDNTFYLDHDFYKNYSSKGAIFADYRDKFDELEANTIIYGHHRLDNTMFGDIDKLFTNNYYNNKDHSIKLVTTDKTYIFEVFSVYEIEPEVYYLTTYFNEEEDFLTFLNTIKKRSVHNFNITTDNDKVLTLSTCNSLNTGRIVVHAILKEEKATE